MFLAIVIHNATEAWNDPAAGERPVPKNLLDYESPEVYRLLDMHADGTSDLLPDNLVTAVVKIETTKSADQLTREEEEESMLAETVKRWTEEWYQEGRQEGRQEGAVATLRDLVTLKFGAEVAAQLPALVEGLSEADRIEVVAAAVIQCDTGEEFIARTQGDRGVAGDGATKKGGTRCR